jgi:hypothetical protein
VPKRDQDAGRHVTGKPEYAKALRFEKRNAQFRRKEIGHADRNASLWATR